jgi:DNA polymerase (family 10)
VATANNEVATLLRELADLTKLEDGSAQSFRVRAYERAVDAVRSLPGDVSDMSVTEIKAVDGIGESTAKKIREYVDTGSIAKLEELRAEYPPSIRELTKIPGLGPKTVLLVRSELGVETVDDLRQAIAAEQLRRLPGLGATSEEKIGRAIERLGLHGKDRRTPIIEVLPVAEQIVAALAEVPAVAEVRYCGSLRRFRETIADVDVLVASTEPHDVAAAFRSLPLVDEVIAAGDTKSAILTSSGLQVDLRVVAPDEWGAATLYFTGSKEHNIALRQLAIDRGWLLNEYALSDAETEAVVASETEAAIYQALDLPLIAAALREDRGEIEAAANGTLPDLVTVDDIRGDLHVHSTWSGDGRSTLDEMVTAAAERGLDYIAMTEHGEDLPINGLSRDQVIEERAEVERLRGRHEKLTILHGAELNIGRSGSLDYDETGVSPASTPLSIFPRRRRRDG